MREFALIGGGLTVFGVLMVASTAYAADASWMVFVPLGLIALGIAGWVVLAAAAGSPAAIMGYFAILAFMTDAQFRVRGAGDIQADWQSMLKFAIWLGAGVIGFADMPSFREIMRRPGPALWLAYIAIALISSLYSPVPGYSFGCSLALLCLFAFSFTLTTRLSESQLLWTLVISLTVFCIAGWVVFYTYPALGTSPFWTYGGMYLRMCGLAGQATNLGALCTKYVGAVFLLWYTGRCRFLPAVILGGFASLTLVASDARTAEIAVIAGVGAVFLSRSKLAMSVAALAGFIGFVLVEIFPHLLNGIGAKFSRSGDPSELTTLTGRLEIWDFAWRKITESPILGWGYNSSKVVLGTYYDLSNGLMVDSAHNMYLQNLLSVGVLGTLPLAILLIYLGVKFFARPIPIVCYFWVVILVSSISDTDAIGTTPTLMTMVFLVVSVWPALRAPERVEAPAPGLLPELSA